MEQEPKYNAGLQRATFLALGGICITGILYSKRQYLTQELIENSKEMIIKSVKNEPLLMITPAALSIWFAGLYKNFKSNSIMDRILFSSLMTSYHGNL